MCKFKIELIGLFNELELINILFNYYTKIFITNCDEFINIRRLCDGEIINKIRSDDLQKEFIGYYNGKIYAHVENSDESYTINIFENGSETIFAQSDFNSRLKLCGNMLVRYNTLPSTWNLDTGEIIHVLNPSEVIDNKLFVDDVDHDSIVYTLDGKYINKIDDYSKMIKCGNRYLSMGDIYNSHLDVFDMNFNKLFSFKINKLRHFIMINDRFIYSSRDNNFITLVQLSSIGIDARVECDEDIAEMSNYNNDLIIIGYNGVVQKLNSNTLLKILEIRLEIDYVIDRVYIHDDVLICVIADNTTCLLNLETFEQFNIDDQFECLC